MRRAATRTREHCWRGAAASACLSSRRDAATYFNIAVSRLNNASLREAATAFQNSVAALENARAAMNDAASPTGRNCALSLERVAQDIDNALHEETRATELLERQR